MLATRVFWLLLAMATVSVAVRTAFHEVGAEDLRDEPIFRFEQAFSIQASPGEFHLLSYLPQNSPRTTLMEENFVVGSLTTDIGRDEHGRSLQLAGRLNAQNTEVRYTATVSNRALIYELDPRLSWRDVGKSEGDSLVATDNIQAGDGEIQTKLAELFDVEDWLHENPHPSPSEWQSRLARSGVGPVRALQTVFSFCQNDVRPATFSGSTDALTTLALMEASCGGKSRLLVALCRTLGFPTRMVGGVILGDARRKRTSHVWVEAELAGEWVPFDPLNDHFARIPANYLTIYHGDAPLIQHSRGLAFDYSFFSTSEHYPRIWFQDLRTTEDGAPSSEPIPLLRRQQFTIILLAPFALLLTVFLRQVVGIDSMGVFLPVLLGFSISQTGWLVGGVQLVLAIAIGAAVRLVMTRLNLLHVPRTATMITLVVLMFLGFSVLLEALGLAVGSASIILPLAALAMTIERYATIAADSGYRDATSLLAQTFLLSAACLVVLETSFYRSLTIAFPEVLLVIIALTLMVGNYRGLRLRELWRFRSLREALP